MLVLIAIVVGGGGDLSVFREFDGDKKLQRMKKNDDTSTTICTEIKKSLDISKEKSMKRKERKNDDDAPPGEGNFRYWLLNQSQRLNRGNLLSLPPSHKRSKMPQRE